MPDPFDPSVPMETEALFKDPLKHKESEHEQEWKFRQVTNSSWGRVGVGVDLSVLSIWGGGGGGAGESSLQKGHIYLLC